MTSSDNGDGAMEVLLGVTARDVSNLSGYTLPAHDDAEVNVNDASFDKEIRIVALYVIIVLGATGGALMLVWLWFNRRRKSRVNTLILNVCMSDLLVIVCACVPQLIWEYSERHWLLGELCCKLLKFMQSFTMMASNYMLVILSFDRHQAIRSPLREPITVWKMTSCAWGAAVLLSSPQLYVFHTNYVTEAGPFQNMTVCESIWRMRPLYERQIYLAFVPIVVFVIPLVIIAVCYVRIFLKIAQKADQGRKQVLKPGKVHLTSTGSSSLPKAKIKTLKMTCVIVSVFVVCGLPYFVLELIYNYGHHSWVPREVAAFLGSMPVANSATNPWVFLLFNVNQKCMQLLLAHLGCHSLPLCLRFNKQARTDYSLARSDYSLNSSRTEYTTMDAKDHDRTGHNAHSKDVIEMCYEAKGGKIKAKPAPK